MTLEEKEKLLRRSVALPTEHDYAFLDKSPAVRRKLTRQINKILLNALNVAKSAHTRDRGMCYGDIWDLIAPGLDLLERAHPDAGLGDSEVYVTIARFFALNYSTEAYHFFRFPSSARLRPIHARFDADDLSCPVHYSKMDDAGRPQVVSGRYVSLIDPSMKRLIGCLFPV